MEEVLQETQQTTQINGPVLVQAPPEPKILNQRVRVSVRPRDWTHQRYMILVDLGCCHSLQDFISQCLEIVFDDVQSLDKINNYILVLEPDVIVSDLETLRKDDNLLITTQQKFDNMQKTLEVAQQQLWHNQKISNQLQNPLNPLFTSTFKHASQNPQQQQQLAQQSVNTNQPNPSTWQQVKATSRNQYGAGQVLSQLPRRVDVHLHKVGVGNNLVMTPDMEEILETTKGFQLSQDLLGKVSQQAMARGFRIYRHSVGPQSKEFRLLLMCGQYQSQRCPFLLTYKKPDLPNSCFYLVRYRPEHNHPLGKCGSVVATTGRTNSTTANYQPQYNEM